MTQWPHMPAVQTGEAGEREREGNVNLHATVCEFDRKFDGRGDGSALGRGLHYGRRKKRPGCGLQVVYAILGHHKTPQKACTIAEGGLIIINLRQTASCVCFICLCYVFLNSVNSNFYNSWEWSQEYSVSPSGGKNPLHCNLICNILLENIEWRLYETPI